MHPDEVPRKYPGQDEHIQRPEKDAAGTAQTKPGKVSNNVPVQLRRLAGAHRHVAAGETYQINNFRAQNT